MANTSTSSQGHTLRFYIIMMTIVIGSIFLLLMLNDENNSFSITSAVIEGARNGSLKEIITRDNENQAKAFPEVVLEKGEHEVSFSLATSNVPYLERQLSVDELSFTSTDLSASEVKVNSDSLELNVQRAVLKITGFNGNLKLDSKSISLEGTANRLEVNGIALSAASKISLSFAALSYEFAHFSNMRLNNLDFVSSEGKLTVGTRLSYNLEETQTTSIYNFFGNLNVDKNLNTTTTSTFLEGIASGLDLIGETLNLNLR